MNAPLLNVNATDEGESKHIILHESLSENCSMDVSESKRSIVNRTLSQKNSTDVSENTITELKGPSVTKEVTSNFNILKCGRNILNKLDVTCQRAFMATPEEKYYNALLDTLVKENNIRGEPLYNDNIRQAVAKLIEEMESEFERNYNEITCNTSCQCPILKKDVSKINNSVYYELDEQVNTISDSNKQVDASSKPK